MYRVVLAAGVTALAVLAAFAVASMPSDDASAQFSPFPSREKVIHVTGSATSSVAPDLLVATLGVQTKADTAGEAFDTNSEDMNRVVTAIMNLGISDDELATSSLSVYPIYDGYYDSDDRYHTELVGYEVTNTLRVETADLDLASDIIDTAIDAGANRVDGIRFTLSPETLISVKDGLLEDAVMNARDKAQVALAPLDHNIIGVKSVTVLDPSHATFMSEFAASADYMSAQRAYSAPVFSSDQEVTTTVSVTFLIGSNMPDNG